MRVDEAPILIPPSNLPRADASWSWQRRFGVGFFACYLLLVWVPWCLGIACGVPFGWWFDAGQWAITHVLGLPEHYVESRLAANFLTHYVATGVFVLVSASFSSAWSAIDRRGTTHAVASAWTFLLARFTLSLFLLGYGWVKVLPAQFGLMTHGAGTDYLMQQVGQLPPSDLLWAFMEASRAYQVFTGAIELAAGVLLLMRRTTMWGAFMAVAAMVNVVALDIAYDVVVKFLAAQILLLAIVVAAPYTRGLRTVLARHAEQRSPHGNVAGDRHRRVARVAGVLVASSLVWWTFRAAQGIAADFAAAPVQTPLHGIWDVEEVTRDGVAVPLLITDPSLWRRLALPWAGTEAGAMLVWMSDAVTRCQSRIDTDAQTLVIEPIPQSTVIGSRRETPRVPRRMFFKYTLDHNGGLVLRSAGEDEANVQIRLQRFDHSKYPLLADKYEWRW